MSSDRAISLLSQEHRSTHKADNTLNTSIPNRSPLIPDLRLHKMFFLLVHHKTEIDQTYYLHDGFCYILYYIACRTETFVCRATMEECQYISYHA